LLRVQQCTEDSTHARRQGQEPHLQGNARLHHPFRDSVLPARVRLEEGKLDVLFADLKEQLIDELEESTIAGVEHFFGPIVVMEQTGTDLKEFLVIDGQQRITPIYLLLGIIQEQIRLKRGITPDAASHLKELQKYLANDVADSDDYLKLKVFSCKGDRFPTYRVIFGDTANPHTPYLQTDLQQYVPGNNQIDEFKKYALRKLKSAYPDVPALWELVQVLLNCLKIVWIPLNAQKDEAQSIFESLNHKGVALRASELICNFIFRPIIEEKTTNYEDLHNNLWLGAIRQLDGDYDKFEEYLRRHFSIGENKMVGKDRKVYVHFKSKNPTMNAAKARQQLTEIFAGVPLYRTIVDPALYPHKNDTYHPDP
jgi:hypothetical protein